MQTFIIISIAFSILYVFQIGLYAYGFIKLKAYTIIKRNIISENKTYITVIIPIKNEEGNLEVLIKNLKNQSLNKFTFEVLLVNDHSNDNSEQVISKLIENIGHFDLISLTDSQKGKKQAIKHGISNAKGELIVTSDADCEHQTDWLENILHFYLEHNSKMIIGPVLMKGTSFFQKIQSLEYLSLSSSTAGASGINHPTMCSGANLAYKRDTFEAFKDALYSKETSGDDVFLMHTIKRKHLKDIHYLKSNKAAVYTEAEKSFRKFMKQRLRWVSKSKSYFDFDTIFSSILVLLMNLLIVSLIIVSFFNNSLFFYLIFVFSIKLVADLLLLFLTAKYFKQKQLLYFFPLSILLYPFYIIIIAFSGLLIKKVKWKD